MGAFGFPQKAYGGQKSIIKHPSQGEAKSAGGSQWTNGLRQSFDGMCAKVTHGIQENLQRMETYVENANNEHKERKQKESRNSLGKCQLQFSANPTFNAKHYKVPTANKN